MVNRDAELEQLRAGVNCATLLERCSTGWMLDRRESTRRAPKYRRQDEILIINHDGRGWWDPLSEAKGDVFSLAQHLDPSLNFPQVCKLLRGLLGIAPSEPELPRASRRDDTETPAPAERWNRARRLLRGSQVWNYLRHTRRLPADALVAADGAGVLREGPYGTAWFAHRDHDGLLTGFEMRGPEFRGFIPGGRKTLFQLPGPARAVTRLVVCEAAIDALSFAALERLRPNTLYVSMAGGMGPDTIATLKLLLRDLAAQSTPMVAVATDANKAGERFAVRVHEFAREAGVPAERWCPPPPYIDWNELLQADRKRKAS